MAVEGREKGDGEGSLSLLSEEKWGEGMKKGEERNYTVLKWISFVVLIIFC